MAIAERTLLLNPESTEGSGPLCRFDSINRVFGHPFWTRTSRIGLQPPVLPTKIYGSVSFGFELVPYFSPPFLESISETLLK
jgi:hypothetical protein